MENGEQAAYPTQGNSATGELEGGVTKREFIATMAMQGLLARESYKTQFVGTMEATIDPEGIANDAVIFADALLKALSNKQP